MFFVIVCIVLSAVIYLTIRPLFYWSNKGVKQSRVLQVWWKNIKIVFQTVSVADATSDHYNSFENERYVGIYHFFNPLLLIRDPDLIKQLMVKDFEHFIDHTTFIDDDLDPLWAKNLFSLKGEKWKDMRATLSPSFTSSKMRAMFGLMKECAENFVEVFKKDYRETINVDLKDAFTRYANDVIASAAFGVTCNSMIDRENEFYLKGRAAVNFSGTLRNLEFLLMGLFPKMSGYLNLKMFSDPVRKFFTELIKNNMNYREKNGIVRPDMIHLLMEAKKGRLKHEEVTEAEVDTGFATIEESSLGKQEKRQKQELTDEDITAQAMVFFLAGSDSVSTALCFTVYELAVNPDVQKRLQDEIDKTLFECHNNVTYEVMIKMKYLDMVLSEALRKWPITTTVDRVCVKPYTIRPIKEDEKPLDLKKGDILWIPTHALHHSPSLFPQPEIFNPDRFSEENKSKIHPYSYLPFGSGPRSCIANRFALLEIKILIFNILANFDFVVVEKTKIPIKISKKQFNLNSEDDIYVGFRLRKVKSQ